MKNPPREEIIEAYVRFRNTVRDDFMKKYEGLNVNGTDYREYVFNYFENIFSARL